MDGRVTCQAGLNAIIATAKDLHLSQRERDDAYCSEETLFHIRSRRAEATLASVHSCSVAAAVYAIYNTTALYTHPHDVPAASPASTSNMSNHHVSNAAISCAVNSPKNGTTGGIPVAGAR